MLSKLFVGADIPLMEKEADRLAKEILGTESLELHPDYLRISIEKGKKTIGVEEVLPIVEKGNVRPVLADHAVVVIDSMDKLTESAQNKLLLTLESSPYVVVIGIAATENILATVRSRIELVRFKTISKKEFADSMEKRGLTESAELLYYASSGNPCLIEGVLNKLDVLKKAEQICLSGSLQDLLPVLSLVKEKDSDAVNVSLDLLIPVLRVLQYAMLKRALAEREGSNDSAAARYAEYSQQFAVEQTLAVRNNYTKDHFFLTLVKMIEEERRSA